jgi:hypothetical protein
MVQMTTKTDCKQDALVAARNAAHDAQEEYAEITAGVGDESLGKRGRRRRQDAADKLYEATRELINHIDNNLLTLSDSSDGFHCNWCGLDANGHEK